MLTDSLPPDECDKMRDFLNSLIRTDQSARACGKRLDVMAFMQNYRDQNATFVTEYPRGMQQKYRDAARQRMERLRPYLIAHKDEKICDVGKKLGLSTSSVAKYYEKLKIQRVNLNGHARKGT